MKALRTWNLILSMAMAVVVGVLTHRSLPDTEHAAVHTLIELTTTKGGNYDLFLDAGDGFRGDRSIRMAVPASDRPQRVEFIWPLGSAGVDALRFDPGDSLTDVVLHSLSIEGPGGDIRWNASEIMNRFGRVHGLETLPQGDDRLVLHIRREDPWIATSGDLSSIVLRIAQGPSPLSFWAISLASASAAFALSLWLLIPFVRSSTRNQRTPTKVLAVLLLIDVLLFTATFGISQRIGARATGITFEVQALIPSNDVYQLFYSRYAGRFGPEQCVATPVKASQEPQWLRFELPQDTLPTALRFDPGSHAEGVVIYSAAFAHGDVREHIGPSELLNAIDGKHDIASAQLRNGGLTLHFNGGDPYISLADLFHERMVAVIERDKPHWLPLLMAAMLTLLAHAGLLRSSAFTQAVDAAAPRDLRLACAFLVLILLPLFTVFAPLIEIHKESSEKRQLARLPVLELRSLGEFPARYDTWYREHFGFRQELFRWNSWTHIKVLNASPMSDKLVVGKNGWLFQYNADVDGDYRGRILYTFDQLEGIRRIYENRQRWLAAYGIRYYILVPPLSGNLNREHMDDRFHRVSNSTWLDQVKDHFDKYSTVELIDMRQDLIAAKKEREVYFKTDIHWNPYGAYFGYRKLIERVQHDIPAIGPPCGLDDLAFRVDTNEKGDLAGMMGLGDVLTRVEPFLVPLRPRKSTFSHFPELPGQYYFLDRPMTFTQPDTTLPKLLMFHDSFGLYLKPLINEHFSKSTYVWAGLFIPDVVVAEKPDVVVQEFMEMFVVNMSKDSLALSR